ncbi:MAG: outer membrane lipoprotein carrier protein LolA [Bacteroidales bacterium]|nr:outer membrane lipoprotein carrier protein LolA [Bacteroidales bacterium]MBK7171669.1 outer membrane lipoprotein carrier protein LolA [Bacteroidales bacterium]
MKKSIIISILLAIAIGSYAQGDTKATTILNEVSAKTKAYKTVLIDFTYTMENKKEKINDKFNGTLKSKGDKYKLLVARQEVISDGKTVWTYLKDANEVQINNAGVDDDSFTPTKLLSNYSKEYKSKFIEEKGNTQIIELYPLAKGKSFIKVKLSIDKTKKQIQQFVIHDKGGSVFTYLVNKFVTDQPINDKEFTFNKADHPGVTIDDMR